MPHILLLGAGFSRNWGGWLADEAFEYLLGHPRIDDGLRTLLWRYKGQGGFEAAYDEQQTETSKPGRSVAMLDHAQRLDEAIRGMFTDMDKVFAELDRLNLSDAGVEEAEAVDPLASSSRALRRSEE